MPTDDELRDAHHEEQGEAREHLAQARPRHDTQRGPRQVTAGHDHEGHRARHLGRAEHAARGVTPGQHRNEATSGMAAMSWKRRNRERRAPERRREERALAHRLHGDGGRRERERQPRDERRLPRQAEEQPAHDERAPARDELQRAASEHGGPQAPEPLGIELEADEKEHQHDAELGKVQDGFDVAHEPEAPGAIAQPAMRYPSTEPSRNRLASGTKTTAAAR